MIDISVLKDCVTPLYLYDMTLLSETVEALKASAARHGISVNYALKANCCQPVVDSMNSAGFGADCVSGNEVSLALKSGFKPENVFFAGAGKTDDEIRTALRAGIAALVVESLQELEIVDSLASELGIVARVMLRFNPDVDAHTHSFITTGTSRNKFGIAWKDVTAAIGTVVGSRALEFVGLHMHIGSQITDMQVFEQECGRMNELQDLVEAAGLRPVHISLGGGLGVDYECPEEHPIPDFEGWLSVIDRCLRRREGQIVHVEPGRSLVAQCGSLVSRVLFVKSNESCNFAVLDAGMNDLIRPALYGAHHHIDNLSAALRSEKRYARFEVVGPVCESSDVFASDELLPVPERGDIVAIRSAGAYGATMSSQYNLKTLAESLYV